MPRFSDSRSRRSPTTRSVGKSATFSRRLPPRTRRRNSAPCASSSRATWLPRKPVAPVTKHLIPFTNYGKLRAELMATPCDARGPQLLFLRRRRGFGVGRKRDQWEVLAVHVVHQVEHPREAGAGVPLFIPRTIAALRLQQVGDAALQRVAARVIRCQESHHGPCGLRCRARTDALRVRVVVGATSLAPSPVGILHHTQPLGSLLNARLMMVHASRFQSPQDKHSAVDIVDTPAAKPRTIRFLLALEEL